jgi:ribosomal-protein-serine acetyltransferase
MIERQPILTERLRLEPLGSEHVPKLWLAIEPSLPNLQRWMPWAQQATEETTREFAERSERDWENGTDYAFATMRGDEHLGGVGLHIDRLDGIGQLGYWIRSDEAGKGYTPEAVGALVVLAFETVGLYRLELRAGVENRPSQRVAEKLGFTKEGTLRRGCPLDSEHAYDCHLYGLLAAEWRAA